MCIIIIGYRDVRRMAVFEGILEQEFLEKPFERVSFSPKGIVTHMSGARS